MIRDLLLVVVGLVVVGVVVAMLVVVIGLSGCLLTSQMTGLRLLHFSTVIPKHFTVLHAA